MNLRGIIAVCIFLSIGRLVTASATLPPSSRELVATVLWTEHYATRPAITSNGKDYLVCWVDVTPGATRALKAVRLRNDGSVSNRFVVSDSVIDEAPAIAEGCGNYVVAWRTADGLWTRFISDIGQVGEIERLGFARIGGKVTAAGSKFGFAVGLQEPTEHGWNVWVYGMWPDGGRDGAFLATLDSQPFQEATKTDWPLLVGGPSSVMLLWTEFGATTNLNRRSLRANPFRPRAPNFTSKGVAGRYSQTAEQQWPAAAWNRGTYLATWTDLRRKRGNGDVNGAFIDARANVRRLFRVASGKNVEHRSAVAAMRDGFMVAWLESAGTDATQLRGRFINARATSPAGFGRTVTLWDDLGERGYAVMAGASGRSVIAILQTYDGDVPNIVAVRYEQSDSNAQPIVVRKVSDR